MGEYNMSPSTLSLNKDSHTISKMRPKIKIIHIIAPEIIKTDVENFRELVQRLTGKPSSDTEKKRKKLTTTTSKMTMMSVAEKGSLVVQQEKTIKCEVVKMEEEFVRDVTNDHHELWMDPNPGGFLSVLEEDECFFQGISDFLQPLGSSRVDLVGEMYAS